MLSARGLISVIKGKGVYVRQISADTVTNPMQLYLQLKGSKNYALDIIHARQIIEPPIAALAALNHTDEDARKLMKDIEDLKKCDDIKNELAQLDMTFHLDVAKSSENIIIPLILDPIHRLMPDIKKSVYEVVGNAKESAITWHSKITEQILAKNAEGARQAMIDHLAIAEEHIRKMLAAQEEGID
jgi:GntR family transcriptional repressor for pyruvate dehydrogenase complex